MAYLNSIQLSTQTTGITVPALGSVQDNYLRVPEIDNNFYSLNDGTALLWKILSALNSGAPVSQPKYDFYEDDEYANFTTVNGALNDSATSLTLDENLAVAGSVIFIPETGENVLVSANTSGTLTIERGYQGTTAAAIPDGTDAIIGLPVLEEGGTIKNGISQLPTRVDNYVSMFSSSVSATDVQELTDMINGVGQTSREMMKLNTLIMKQMDQVIRRTYGSLDANYVATGSPAYHTKGLEEYITTSSELPVDLTWESMNTQFVDAFDETNSSGEKTLFASSTLFTRINNVAWKRYNQPLQFEKILGASLMKIELENGGIVNVIRDHKGFPSTYGTQGYLLDMNFVELRSLNGMDLIWREVTLPTDHQKKFEVFGSTSLCLKLPALHRKVTLA